MVHKAASSGTLGATPRGPAACAGPLNGVFSFLFTVKATFAHEKILK